MKILIGFCLILAPLVILGLLHSPLFSWALGSVDSWIAFWGSYLGALIGAGIVYFVTNKQVQAQRELHSKELEAQVELLRKQIEAERETQLDLLKDEHNNALKRDMRQFYFRNQVEKIEGFYDLIDELVLSTNKCLNDFFYVVKLSDIYYKSRGGSESEQLVLKIEELQLKASDWYDILNSVVFKMRSLQLSVENTGSTVNDIGNEINNLIKEIKTCYGDRDSLLRYTKPDTQPLSKTQDSITDFLSKLRNVLQPQLNAKIKEMKTMSEQ
ncbi:hypothetical protein [Jeotgalibacillus marinus]|uniref:Phage abortive infection protein n=1 Tax=Jeotgalibacillus marinus TaxID=86667 RepID=A0ABV3Q671_9BACL